MLLFLGGIGPGVHLAGREDRSACGRMIVRLVLLVLLGRRVFNPISIALILFFSSGLAAPQFYDSDSIAVRFIAVGAGCVFACALLTPAVGVSREQRVLAVREPGK